VACVLRVVGRSFDVAAFIRDTSLTTDNYYRDRFYRSRSSRVPDATEAPLATRAGLSVTASHADMDDPAGQIRDSIEFLSANAAELRRLRAFPGVDSICLDFAIRWRDVAAQTDTFPVTLLRLLGELDIELVVSHYPVADADDTSR
jgi:hypothetical protein